MQKWKIVSIILMLCAVNRVSAQKDSYDIRVQDYISKFKDWAIAEQKRSGVPAAITLAQGIHETSAGNSELALNANNHFGIKCRKEWNGETYAYTDDAPDECFRKYPSALQSYKDHSDYLSGSKRYNALFQLSAKDYKGWAYGLKRCGYATNPKYSQIIIRIVEEYNLQDFTYAALQPDFNPVRDAENPDDQNKQTKRPAEVIPDEDAEPQKIISSKRSGLKVGYENKTDEIKDIAEGNVIVVKNTATPEYGQVVRVNGLRAFYAQKGTTLLEAAVKNNVPYIKLLEMNDLADTKLEADMFIYFEKKRTKGISGVHLVQDGETLIQIAQKEGVQLKWVKYYNRIGGNEEPASGSMLQLQLLSDVKPATYPKVAIREAVQGTFPGARPEAIPPGATRMRRGYLSKEAIEQANNEPVKKMDAPTSDPKMEASLPVTTVPSAVIKKVVTKEIEHKTEAKVEDDLVEVYKAPKPEPKIVEPEPLQEKIVLPVTENISELKKSEQDQKIIEQEVSVAKNEKGVDEVKELVEPEVEKPAVTTKEPASIIRKEETVPITHTAETEHLATAIIKEETVQQKEIPAAMPPVVEPEIVAIQEQATQIQEEDDKHEDAVTKVNEVKSTTESKSEPVVTSTKLDHYTVIPAAATKTPKPSKKPVAVKKEEKVGIKNISPEKIPVNSPAISGKNTVPLKKEEVIANQEEEVKQDVSNKEEEKPTIPEPEYIASLEKTKLEPKPIIAQNVSPVPSKVITPVVDIPREPKDEYERLKFQLDKVVYASDKASSENMTKKEEPKKTAPVVTSSIIEKTDPSKIYTVKKGDTVFTIAKTHNVSMKQIMDWNKLDFESVKVGQKLKVQP